MIIIIATLGIEINNSHINIMSLINNNNICNYRKRLGSEGKTPCMHAYFFMLQMRCSGTPL